MNFDQFRRIFFSNRGINNFDGRMLSKYKLTDEEYSYLLNHLGGNYYFTSSSYAPFYVLLACEIWKREWSGGHYSWDFIFNRLNIDPDYNDKRNATKIGFIFCKRSLRKSVHSTRYLGSIVAEAGIPNKIINTDGNSLLNLIKQVYKISIASSKVIDVEFLKTIVEGAYLPKIYQHDDFYELIIEIVTGLHELNDSYKLNEHKEPVSYLNDNHPNWDENLPITITEENTYFYNRLLSDVAEIAEKSGRSKLKVEYSLMKNTWDTYSMDFKLFNKSGPVEPMSLGISDNELNLLGSRFEMIMEVGEKQHVFCSFTRMNNGKLRRIGSMNSRLLPHYDSNIRFFVTNGSSNKELNIWSYSFVDQTEPLVFVKKKDKFVLHSTGSARIKDEEYKLLVPNDFECVFEESCEELKFEKSDRYSLFDVSGSCTIASPEGIEYSVKTGVEGFLHLYQLKKSSKQFFPILADKNQDVSIGCPQLYQYNKSGMLIKRFKSSELEYYHNKTWNRVHSDLTGRKKIRKVIDGETVFSAWVNLLPATANISYGNSSIKIDNLNGFFQLPDGLGEDLAITDSTILFKNPNFRKVFKLKLFPNDNGKPVQLYLPSSFEPVSLLNEKNELIPDHTNISLRSMAKHSLCLFNETNSKKAILIELKLKCGILKSDNLLITKALNLGSRSSLQQGLITFRDDVELLFSLTNNHDALVDISIDDQFRFSIKQYDFSPQLEQNKYNFPESSNVLGLRLDEEIKENCVKEFQVDYQGNYQSEEHGLWLYFPGVKSQVFFRPVVEAKQLTTDASEDSLSNVSLFSNYKERAEKLKSFLKSTLVDFNSPVWKEIENLAKIAEANNLPLSTFDVFRVLSRSLKLLPYLMWKMPEEFIWKFTKEFSIIWAVVKVQSWKKSLDECCNYYAGLGMNPEYLIAIVNSKLVVLDNSFNMKEVSFFLRQNVLMGQSYSSSYSFSEFKAELNLNFNGAEGVKGLRARHIDEKNWPNHHFNTLRLIIDKIEKEYAIRPKVVGYHRSMEQVYFLPVVFAYLSIKEDEFLEELVDIENRFHILQTIDFDSTWFNNLFNLATKFFLSKIN